MVYVPLVSSGGQVLKDIKLKAPAGSFVYDGNDKIEHDKPTSYTVTGNKRIGINRYKINLKRHSDGKEFHTYNYNIRKKWDIVGDWHSPEKIAKMFGRSKVDPDANKPRSERASFWNMKSKPGTHNYAQKQRLGSLKNAVEKNKMKSFKEHLEEQILNEGPKDAAGKDIFVKKIAKSAGVDYKAAGAIAAAAGRKRLGNTEFQKRVEAGQKAAAKARAKGEKYKG
jgi:Holliday junction resolvasome RuvABC endonuclease subunit